ncbi:hypothetical protein [Actinophytocola sediminis]
MASSPRAAQREVPSPFSVARQIIHERWPSQDRQVRRYRDWFTAFEQHRNELIAAGAQIPTQLFDSVLSHVHHRFTRGLDADFDHIPSLFAAPVTAEIAS